MSGEVEKEVGVEGGQTPRVAHIMEKYPLGEYEYWLYPSKLLVDDVLEYGLCESVYFIAAKHPDGECVEVVAWFLTSAGWDKKSMWFDTEEEFRQWMLSREWKKIKIWDRVGPCKVYYHSQLS